MYICILPRDAFLIERRIPHHIKISSARSRQLKNAFLPQTSRWFWSQQDTHIEKALFFSFSNTHGTFVEKKTTNCGIQAGFKVWGWGCPSHSRVALRRIQPVDAGLVECVVQHRVRLLLAHLTANHHASKPNLPSRERTKAPGLSEGVGG